MEYYTIALTCCLAIISHAAHIPEVYETANAAKQTDKFQQPPVFNYEEYKMAQRGTQFDPQRIRYQQQQQVDTRPNRQAKFTDTNLNNRKPLTTLPTLITTFSSVTTAPPVSTFPSTSIRPAPSTTQQKVVLEDLEKETSQTRTPKSKIAKKSLQPNSYLVTEEEEPAGPAAGNRQDDSNYLNYVSNNNHHNHHNGQKIISQNLAGFSGAPTNGDQLAALNSLLGQSPENQLHGLQQLLNDRGHHQQHQQHQQQNYNNHYYKENSDGQDYPNAQLRPNKGQNHLVNQALQSLNKNGNNNPDLKSLQQQLDHTASAHAESIIAQAQKKALEHVKAQHEAIARAQKQAEQQALEQIKQQNEALARAHAEQEAERQQQEEAKQKEDKRKAAERRRQHEQARERARVAALAYKLKQEQEKKEKEGDEETNHQATRNNHNFNINNNKPINNQKHKIKKYHNAEPQETQNHYFTTHAQPHFTPVQLFPQAATAQTHTIHHAPHIAHTPSVAASVKQPVYEHKPIYNQAEDHAEVDKYYNPPQFTVIGHTKNQHGEQELQYAANYEFGYRIRDYDHGNDYGHKETKDGETTKGEYHALLPDGRTQTVTYYVDESGYHAEVTYGGDAGHGGHEQQ